MRIIWALRPEPLESMKPVGIKSRGRRYWTEVQKNEWWVNTPHVVVGQSTLSSVLASHWSGFRPSASPSSTAQHCQELWRERGEQTLVCHFKSEVEVISFLSIYSCITHCGVMCVCVIPEDRSGVSLIWWTAMASLPCLSSGSNGAFCVCTF